MERVLVNKDKKTISFAEEVIRLPGGEKINACIQCGTCSGSCPTCYEMDYTPRKIINMIRAELKEEVLSSKAIWLCASCYSCTTRCPRGIVITDLMYALKNLAIEQGYVGDKALAPNFYRSFNQVIEGAGRLNEGQLITRFAFKTDIKKLFAYAPIGLKLFARKKIAFFPPSVKNKREFKKIIAYGKRGEYSEI